jgi:hypothetical protein
MNYNSIISEYYTQKDIITFFKNIANEWWEELRQDVFLTICEYNQEKIIDMHERKCLKFFIVRIGLNQFRSKNSKFYYQNFKNQRISDNIIDDELIENSDHILFANHLFELQDDNAYKKIESKIQAVEKSISELRFFECEVLKLYLQLGTYKNVSLKTGIPIRTIANGVKNAINNVKLNLKEYE